MKKVILEERTDIYLSDLTGGYIGYENHVTGKRGQIQELRDSCSKKEFLGFVDVDFRGTENRFIKEEDLKTTIGDLVKEMGFKDVFVFETAKELYKWMSEETA